MNILVVGSGGREHALVHTLARSPGVKKIFAAPGNAGVGTIAERIPISAEAIDALVEWTRRERPDLVVIGPENPLAAGLADRLREIPVPVFGPSQEGARLESSKIYAKQFLKEAGVPTANGAWFSDVASARRFLEARKPPFVLKADGLAAGKGVSVCSNLVEAEQALKDALIAKKFGESGSRVLIEDFMEGEEASLLVFLDGRSWAPMVGAQDYKRAFDGDQGPNTGGMGSISPTPVLSENLYRDIEKRIIEPIVYEMRKRKIDYRGVLYLGLMITSEGPKIVELNCRFGDPEAQVVLPRLKSDFARVCAAVAEGRLREVLPLKWSSEAAACVVLAAPGYPERYPKGLPIEGLEEAQTMEHCLLFHAGTDQKNGRWVTSGGRVLNVTALGPTLRDALNRAYRCVEKIHWEGIHFRKDIGYRALQREQEIGGCST